MSKEKNKELKDFYEKDGNELSNENKKNKINLWWELKIIAKILFFIIFFPILIFKKARNSFLDNLKKLLELNKVAIFIITINVIVFLLINLLLNIKNDLFKDLFIKIFISHPENLYFLSLSFIFHLSIEHLLVNITFLYYSLLILAREYSFLKIASLYFIFGFMINFFYFLINLIFKLESNGYAGASGVIFSFITILIVKYPFSLSIIPLLVYYIFYEMPYLNLFFILEIPQEILNLGINDSIAHDVHLLGVLIALIYLKLFEWKNLKKINKLIYYLMIAIILFFLFIKFYKF